MTQPEALPPAAAASPSADAWRDLLVATERPEPFTPSDGLFWDDPWIGEQLLAAHLDERTLAASRPAATRERTEAHLVAQGLAGPGVDVLDLGCGPGLLATGLARAGARVTGVDLNEHSLAYAEATAREQGLDVTYLRQDFRTIDAVSRYDLALQSYGELSTFDDATRDAILARVHAALRPGGALVFDVSTPECHPDEPPSWYRSEGGFWRAGAHLELWARLRYPGDVVCDRYVVIDAGGVTTYRMWFHDYTPDTLTPVLERAGFRVEALWGGLDGGAPGDDPGWFAVVARRD